jgi:hypothetical protein
VLFAALCYLLFGAGTHGNVLENRSRGAFLTAVRVLLCMDLLFTMPMVLAAGREIVEAAAVAAVVHWLELHELDHHTDKVVRWARNVLRTALQRCR